MAQSCGHPERPNDEHYTPYETAEYLLNKYGYLMKGKKVILPCDTEQSELYKACLRHGIDCDISQDMFNVDYTKYDLVFTNPPFSCCRKYVRFLTENNVKFILFAGWITAIYIICDKQNKNTAYDVYYLEDFSPSQKSYTKFITPDGESKPIHWGLISSLPEARVFVEAKPDIRIKPTKEYQNYRGIFSDWLKCNYLPYEWWYDGRSTVPSEERFKVRLKEDK